MDRAGLAWLFGLFLDADANANTNETFIHARMYPPSPFRPHCHRLSFSSYTVAQPWMDGRDWYRVTIWLLEYGIFWLLGISSMALCIMRLDTTRHDMTTLHF